MTTLSPKTIDETFTIKYFLKKSWKHIWNHQTLYVSIMLLMVAVNFVFYLMPKPVLAVAKILIGFYFIFLIYEVTYLSTQQKYTIKRFIASMYVAGLFFVSYIKDKKLFISILLILTFLLRIKDIGIYEINMNDFIYYGLGFGTCVDVAVIALFNYRKLASDEFMVARLSGDIQWNETHNSTSKLALEKNVEMVTKIGYTLVIATFSILLLFLQPLFFVLVMTALTFYSMEVFGVDTGIKEKQEQEEVEKKMMSQLTPIKIN